MTEPSNELLPREVRDREPDPTPSANSAPDPETVTVASDTGIVYRVVKSELGSHGISII